MATVSAGVQNHNTHFQGSLPVTLASVALLVVTLPLTMKTCPITYL